MDRHQRLHSLNPVSPASGEVSLGLILDPSKPNLRGKILEASTFKVVAMGFRTCSAYYRRHVCTYSWFRLHIFPTVSAQTNMNRQSWQQSWRIYANVTCHLDFYEKIRVLVGKKNNVEALENGWYNCKQPLLCSGFGAVSFLAYAAQLYMNNAESLNFLGRPKHLNREMMVCFIPQI